MVNNAIRAKGQLNDQRIYLSRLDSQSKKLPAATIKLGELQDDYDDAFRWLVEHDEKCSVCREA